MRPRLKSLRYNGDFRLAVAFDDGLVAELDFASHLAERTGPVIDALGDEAFFAQAYIDHGVLTWPNGYDVCPDVLRRWSEVGCVLSREETEARFAQPEPESIPRSI